MMYSRQIRRRSRTSQEFVWPAPVAGLVRSGTKIGADPRGCELLENFIPTAEGARLRGGSVKWATVTDPVETLFTYQAGASEAFFAATETDIYDITTIIDPETAEFHEVAGLSSGDWSNVQFATPGGQFVVAVNGADLGLRYDGSWNVLNPNNQDQVGYKELTGTFEVGQTLTGTTTAATATILAILPATATTGTLIISTATGTGFDNNETISTATATALADGDSAERSTVKFEAVDSKLLSFVWSHKRRLWFVEKNTLSAWYLPVNSIGGTAVEFPLDGIFSLGGALLFGGTWSQDSGDGLDDLMVFVTTEGQIAVYQGTDPSSASTWSLVGVYRIGKPLGKNTWFRAGGDLVILTEDGIVPVSEALRKDRAALQAAAITSPIEDLWQEAIAARESDFRFSVTLWSTRTTLFLGIPEIGGGTSALVANTRTGAWSTITGWDIRCLEVYQDRLFFGTPDGTVIRGDVSGADMGEPYAGRYVPNFQEMGSSGDKIGLHAQVIYKAAENSNPRLIGFQDYQLADFPSPADSEAASGSTWGTGEWGVAEWGVGAASIVRSDWQSVGGIGFSLSVGLIIGSAGAANPTFELLGTVLRYEQGRSI